MTDDKSISVINVSYLCCCIKYNENTFQYVHQWHLTLDFHKEEQKRSNDDFLYLPHCLVVENNHLTLLMKNIVLYKLQN